MRWTVAVMAGMALLGCAPVTRVVRLEVEREWVAHPVRSEPRAGLGPEALEAAALLRVEPRDRPLAFARAFFGVPERSGAYVYELGSRQVLPAGRGAVLTSEEHLLRERYLGWCGRTLRPGDCLGLFEEAEALSADGKLALALAIAQGAVLGETVAAFRGMARPEAVVTMVVSAMTVYLLLWVLPEPVSKGVAATLTAALIAYLGVEAVVGMVGGWRRLVERVDRAATFEEIRAAGEDFGRVMGEDAARAFVMLTTAALARTGGLVASLPGLPGAGSAARLAAAEGGFQLGAIAGVESIAISAQGAVTIGLAAAAVAIPGEEPNGTARPAWFPHRTEPRIEDGNLKTGWLHIEARHVTGNHPDGPGTLFRAGTTREQLLAAAKEVVQKGLRTSKLKEPRQTFEMRVRVNGQWDLVRVVVLAKDANNVITIFPVRGGP